jgi:hypothetical protein
MVKIYGLVCPVSQQIRYIGKTNQKLSKRLIAHITDAKKSTYSHKRRWIRKCLSLGLRPTSWLLEEVPDGQRWQDREIAWIRRAKELGFDLTNQTVGGEGLDFIDPAANAEYRAKHRVAMNRAREENPSLIRALIDGNKRSWRENREERVSSIRAAMNTPEYKKNLADAMKVARSKQSFKENFRRAARAKWVTNRDTLMKAFARPETKKKQSESKKKAWKDPEKRDRLMNRWTPEARAKQAEALRERQAKIQAAMTPEVRARQSATLKETWAKRKAGIL